MPNTSFFYNTFTLFFPLNSRAHKKTFTHYFFLFLLSSFFFLLSYKSLENNVKVVCTHLTSHTMECLVYLLIHVYNFSSEGKYIFNEYRDTSPLYVPLPLIVHVFIYKYAIKFESAIYIGKQVSQSLNWCKHTHAKDI